MNGSVGSRSRAMATPSQAERQCQRLVTSLVLAACLLAPLKVSSRTAAPPDPIFSIEGSLDAWSVSRSEVGCFLMSPFRRAINQLGRGTSRLAIGSHSKFGFGLYVVGFAIGVPETDPTAAVLIRAGGLEIKKTGRMIGTDLLFVPLDRAEAIADLRQLRESGALWLSIRDTWVAHSGRAVAPAVDLFEKDCAGVAGAAG